MALLLLHLAVLQAETAKIPRPPRPNAPDPREVRISALLQEKEGSFYKLRGQAQVEMTDMLLRADEIDYDDETGDAEARGHVYFQHFTGGEILEADRAEYNTVEETGKYYNVRGSAPAKIEARPGVLTTTNPFSFQGKWAERLRDRYILHDGFVTDCKLPRPWWTLNGPIFDVIPGERAIARRSVFRVKHVPLFYTPFFYKSLEKAPRRSGLLTPNIGNSSRYGKTVALGYYWAINRSYDLTYRAQYFSQRGIAHHVDFRGKPSDRSDFNFILYGVNDRGLLQNNGERLKQGGYQLTADARADLGYGFQAIGTLNYLSSFSFRQAFTQSFFEAVFTESHSIGLIDRHWSTYTLNFVAQRNVNFQTTASNDKITIQKLPSVEFNSRDHQISERIVPVWVSFDSSASLLRRDQPAFQTRQSVERVDVEPRITTELHWADFHVVPSFSIRETHYGSSFDSQNSNNKVVTGNGILRSSRDFSLDLIPPSFARIYNAPSWMGLKLKHVIEPRASFHYVGGVDDLFNQIIRFDETELLSDTKEADFSITNRFYVKRKDGRVDEVLNWQVTQRRFFDPTFGGAITPDTRNVLLSTTTLTAYTFLNVARNYSPIVSTLRAMPDPRVGIEWRTDYDPFRGQIVNSGVSVDGRISNYFLSLGHNQVHSVDVLSPSANQIRGLFGIGQENKRGWSSAFSAVYDYKLGIMQYATTQVTYNTDCCGFSVQYRRFNFGTRNENQFRLAFAISNIGSFGSLKRQERIF
jgi:LPS-assembly protein